MAVLPRNAYDPSSGRSVAPAETGNGMVARHSHGAADQSGLTSRANAARPRARRPDPFRFWSEPHETRAAIAPDVGARPTTSTRRRQAGRAPRVGPRSKTAS